jgi:hypothetical protein
MSFWSDNPEWFDEWIFEKALDGYFGKEIQVKAENDEIQGYDLWDLDKDGKLGSEASTAFIEQFIP